jgi:hypothetical protein
MARQRRGEPGQQALELGRDVEGGAVQGPAFRVGQAIALAGVDEARPESLGEVGPVRRGRVFLADIVVAVVLDRHDVPRLPLRRQGEEPGARRPERLDGLPEPIVAGQDQEAPRLELPSQSLPLGQPDHPVVACQHESLRSSSTRRAYSA